VRELGYRIFGQPPPKGAPRVAILRWVRGFYLKPLPLVLAVYVMLVLWASGTLVLVLAAISALTWLQGFVGLNLRIRREDRRELERMRP
jgi:hypothetical protein